MTGVVKNILIKEAQVVISHEKVGDYMPAMTMPFKVRDPKWLVSLHTNLPVKFQLVIQDQESWIDQIQAITNAVESLALERPKAAASPKAAPSAGDQLSFTNQFGQSVSLAAFEGQPLALTFFFTRCPVPDYCPRLSKNFEEASQKIAALTEKPTNYHFFSITIDPDNDTPARLKAYAETYNYDSNHWTFLTGPKDRILHLTRLFGYDYKPDGAFFNHSFRTVIIDRSNRVQQIFPFSGNFSDSIVTEMLKAAGLPKKDETPAVKTNGSR
jgi:protein SCO1/2